MHGCLLYPTRGVFSRYRDTHLLHQEAGIHVPCYARLQAVGEAEFVALYIRLEAVVLDGVGELVRQRPGNSSANVPSTKSWVAMMPHER